MYVVQKRYCHLSGPSVCPCVCPSVWNVDITADVI